MSTNLIETAVRLHLRFESPIGVGSLSPEDLYSIPLTSNTKANLNDVAKLLAKAIREEESENFVGEASKALDLLNLKLDVVKHVIATLKAEQLADKTRIDNKAHNEAILKLIASKVEDDRKGKTVEELQAMLIN